MSGDWIKWRDEKAIEEWLEQNWQSTDIEDICFPAPPEKCVYDGDSRFPHRGVRRQFKLPNASETHDKPAPCDLVILKSLVSDSDLDLQMGAVDLIVEIKNRDIEPKDFAQLSRYMQAYQAWVPTQGFEFPVHVIGALLGTGISWGAFDVAYLCPSIGLLSIELEVDGVQIIDRSPTGPDGKEICSQSQPLGFDERTAITYSRLDRRDD